MKKHIAFFVVIILLASYCTKDKSSLTSAEYEGFAIYLLADSTTQRLMLPKRI